MTTTCPPAPGNKKEYLTEVGKILVRDFGKKKYYKPKEIKSAHKKSKWYQDLYHLDFSCWAMATYSSHSDFDAHHAVTGEFCDYTAMKTEMLQSLSVSEGSDFLDLSVTNLDIDVSWLDFGEAFGSIFEGIGDFVSGIFDA